MAFLAAAFLVTSLLPGPNPRLDPGLREVRYIDGCDPADLVLGARATWGPTSSETGKHSCRCALVYRMPKAPKLRNRVTLS